MNSNADVPTVLTYREALRCMSRSQLQTMIRSGRGQQPCYGIYLTHNGPILPFERDLIALKACGNGAALAGLTALRRDGFEGFDPLMPTVVQPAGACPPPYDDVIVHWSIWLDQQDIHPHREPHRTRTQRSLVDAASWAASDKQARAIVIAGIQQGLVNTRLLREALVHRGACKHRALIVESILDAHGGIQSLPERDFRQICARFHLPEASRQVPVKSKEGRYYLDVEWSEYGLAVEVHGIPHLRIRNWDDDQLLRMLTTCGWRRDGPELRQQVGTLLPCALQ